MSEAFELYSILVVVMATLGFSVLIIMLSL